MEKLEREFENLLVNFPNFIDRHLRQVPVGEWGEVNVCIRQGRLTECKGRVDLAFVTDSTVYLVELKRDAIDESAVRQISRYYEPVKKRYPNHTILGFVVGSRCPNQESLEESIAPYPIRILIFRRDIPWWTKVIRCRNCRAGTSSDNDDCPYCGSALF